MDNIHLLICNIMCVQQKVNQFHTSLSEKKGAVFTSDHWVCALFHKKATPSMIQDKKNSGFRTFFSPNTFTINLMSFPCPLTSVLSNLCGAAPRWRSPRPQRRKKRPRWSWARAGQSEPSAGKKGLVGPLSRLAPGGCAGSWQPRWASASGGPGAPPGLARDLHAPSLASFPWRGGLKGKRKKRGMKRDGEEWNKKWTEMFQTCQSTLGPESKNPKGIFGEYLNIRRVVSKTTWEIVNRKAFSVKKLKSLEICWSVLDLPSYFLLKYPL